MPGEGETQAAVEALDVLVGEWGLEARIEGLPPGAATGRTRFEWLPGRRFLIQRWEAPDPAPDGIAVIGYDESRGGLVQHYFDSRGVARLYEMSFSNGDWTLLRRAPDFTPLNFAQRFVGRLSADGTTIEGRWETGAADGGEWALDFELTYTKVA